MRKQDPSLAVIRFFETAPPDIAKTILAVCQDILRRRVPPLKAKPRAVKPAAEKTA